MEVLAMISACASCICVGAFCALAYEFYRSRNLLTSAVEKTEDLTKRFAEEHNAMAKKVLDLNDDLNNLKVGVNFMRAK